MVTNSDPIDRLLDAFLGGRNEVRRTPALDPWIRRLTEGSPTVLPYRDDVEGLVLYGISRTPAEARGLAEDLTAAIGPSWSDFDGAPAAMSTARAHEAALLEYVDAVQGAPILRVAVRSDAERRTVWGALERLLRAWELRPFQRSRVNEPIAHVLADFELALQAGASEEAEALLESLRSRGELSSENLLFLELRVLGVEGRYSDLLRHPRLPQVLESRRPSRVTALLFDAIHQEYLAEAALLKDAEEALRVFRDRIRPRFDPVLRTRGALESVAALEVLLLAAVDDGRPAEDRNALVEAVAGASDADQEWLRILAELEPSAIPEPPAADPLVAAEAMLREGRYDDVLLSLKDVDPTQASVLLVLQAAVELDTLDAANSVAKAFRELSADEQAELRTRRLWAGHLDRVLGLASDETEVGSWRAWLTALAKGDLPEAIEIATRGALEWDPAEPVDAAEAEALADALTDIPDARRDVLYRAVPHLLAHMDRQARLADVRMPVDQAVYEVLVYGDPRSRSVQETLLMVLDRLLTAGASREQYDEILAGIDATWDAIRSPRTVDWLLDVIGLLADHPCPNPSARERVLRDAVAEVLRRRDTDSVVPDVLEALAKDVGSDAAVAPLIERRRDARADQPPAAPLAAPPGRIAIYTLSESAAHRAQSLLEARYPGTTIELNHEHDASALLEGVVRRADLVVMVIASAKHSATNAIRRLCPRSRLLEVGSRGSTAIVRAVVEHLADPAEAAA